MKDKRSLRPKNLARNKVALAWASGERIQWRLDLRTQASLQPFRSTLQPLQLIVRLELGIKQVPLHRSNRRGNNYIIMILIIRMEKGGECVGNGGGVRQWVKKTRKLEILCWWHLGYKTNPG